jgi:hypothetical protein
MIFVPEKLAVTGLLQKTGQPLPARLSLPESFHAGRPERLKSGGTDPFGGWFS